MQADFADAYHALEDNHWWFIGRRDAVLRCLDGIPKNARILEVGCSGGATMDFLREQGFNDITGINIDAKGIEIADKKRGFANVFVMDGANTSFPDDHFDVILASDVLEHIQDDHVALQEWMRVLKPKGRLVIFVPAFQELWSHHDERNYHYRRYRAEDLREALRTAGFSIDRMSYWNFALFAPVAMVRFSQRFAQQFAQQFTQVTQKAVEKWGAFLPKQLTDTMLGTKSVEVEHLRETPKLINESLSTLLKIENQILQKNIQFPVGVSVFAIAHRP